VIVAFCTLFNSFGNGGTDNLSPEIRALVGTEYIYPRSMKIIDKYGFPKTLSGTNNSRWVAYFPKGDFTIISDKQTNIIKRVMPGRRPQ
jgi:hypothetical protein